jgi:imidazole glycerol phosphate synthase glutamine amidotransferase subunit
MLTDYSERPVGVLATGAGNTASLNAALRRAGGMPYAVTTAAEVASATHLVLPGVGAFGPVLATLRQSGVLPALKQRVLAGQPTFAICIGMQLLFAASEESPGAQGLSVAPQRVESLRSGPSGRPWTHFGWARVGEPAAGNFAYFAHSYAARAAPDDWSVQYADADVRFVAQMRRGAVVACQYHPEVSGRFGANVLRSWLWEVTA